MKKKAIIAAIILTATFAAAWIVKYGTVGRRAVHMEDIQNYSDWIIVREAFHTGTGWEKADGEDKYQSIYEERDVILSGDIPPYAKSAHYEINSFLCIVDFKGYEDHEVFTNPIQSFEIKEWYPIYPVVRNGLLPSRLPIYPKGYLSSKEMEWY